MKRLKERFQQQRLFWWGVLASLVIKTLIVAFFTPMVLSAYPANDGVTYDRLGWRVASEWREGHWASLELNTQTGLRIVAFSYIVGAIYFLSGHQPLAVQWVNMLISTLGLWFFFKVGRKTIPYGASLSFLLIAFWPSILLWTTLPLKEAWTFMLTGLLAYGMVSMMERRWKFAWGGIGTALTGLILLRPWLAIVALIAMFPFVLVLYYRALWQGQTLLQRAVVLLLVFGVGGMLAYQAVQFSITTSPFSIETLNILRERAIEGGSALEFAPYQSWFDVAVQFPTGLVAFLFRPFPWEVDNLFGSLAALENLGLLVLLLVSIRWWPVHLEQVVTIRPLLLMAAGIVGLFAILGGNLGTMFRLKIHVLPFLLMFSAFGIMQWFRKFHVFKTNST